jgi:glycosyltransferase involved in cell wall biosynthesis
VQTVGLGDEGGPLRYWKSRTTVSHSIREYKPDLIHVHFGYSGLAVPSISQPIVASFYGDDLNGTITPTGRISIKSRIGVVVSQVTAQRSAGCIVVSEQLKQKLWSDKVREKTVVIRDAVDPRVFKPGSMQQARAKLKLDPVARLIIFPHDVTQPTKRLWLAREAVEVLRRSVPTVQLWVVNETDPDAMPVCYAAADAMIITSALEGGPSSAKEALACGLPVVSVPVGDTQLFDDAGAGMLRAAPTAVSLAGALERALAMGAGQRQSYLPRDLTLDRAAQAVVGVYRSALSA